MSCGSLVPFEEFFGTLPGVAYVLEEQSCVVSKLSDLELDLFKFDAFDFIIIVIALVSASATQRKRSGLSGHPCATPLPSLMFWTCGSTWGVIGTGCAEGLRVMYLLNDSIGLRCGTSC